MYVCSIKYLIVIIHFSASTSIPQALHVCPVLWINAKSVRDQIRDCRIYMDYRFVGRSATNFYMFENENVEETVDQLRHDSKQVIKKYGIFFQKIYRKAQIQANANPIVFSQSEQWEQEKF